MSENLPVRRVVLYKHGVAYVERSGPLEGTTASLEFKREDMDDVLKSLLVADKGGGSIVGISYDGAEDVQEKLQKKALVPPEKEALVGLMRKLSGYRLRVQTTSTQVEGEVVGTDETEMIAAGEISVANPKLLLRESGGAIVPVPLRELVNVQLEDDQASEDLQYFLRLVAAERKNDRRNLTVYLEGDRHDLVLSYLTSAPSWRVTYRLDHGIDETYLQAWGIVDNFLEEDLKDVQVSLVAGKPISFVYDVYVPRTVRRPVVREEVRALDTPVELEGAPEELEQAQEQFGADLSSVASMAGGMAAPGSPPAAAPMRARTQAMTKKAEAAHERSAGYMMGSAQVQARKVEGGEFFRYDIENSLTVLRGQSAMVPIVQEKISGRCELVYNGGKVPENPVAVLRWKNSSGVLERGPTVVLEKGTYAGEGILPYTTRDGEVKVAFAVDLGVQISETAETLVKTIGIQIDRTWARRKQLRRVTTTYSVDNRKTEPIDLVIEHPRDASFTLVDTPKPEEETPDLRRFRSALKPKTHATLKVVEERTDWVTQQTQSFGAAMLESVLSERTLSGAVVDQLKALLEIYKSKERAARDMGALQGTRNTLTNEQNRVRANISTVMSTQNKALQQKYTEQLQDLEQKLVNLLEQEEQFKRAIAGYDRQADELIDHWPKGPDERI
jgi:hypothetical protein